MIQFKKVIAGRPTLTGEVSAHMLVCLWAGGLGNFKGGNN